MVIIILGTIAAIAIPRFGGFAGQSRIAAQMAAFRNFEAAILVYRADHAGAWPPNGEDDIPDYLIPYVGEQVAERSPPIGGTWDWNGPGTGVSSWGPSVYDVGDDLEQIRKELELQFDDGRDNAGVIRAWTEHVVYHMADIPK